jgi:hypothetical protein
MGYPLDLAVQCWSRVCDEIVVVTDKADPSDLESIASAAARSRPGCEIKVRAVEGPMFFEVYRFAGYMFCNRPEWVVHFDADYLIGEDQADALRRTILSSPADADIITYRLVYLNRQATATFSYEDMRQFAHPYDGYSGNFPFVLNVRRGNFMSPVDTYAEKNNNRINYESVVNLGEHWGHSYDLKFLRSFGYNPSPMSVVDSSCVVEHLTWSLRPGVLEGKLGHPFWVGRGIGMGQVTDDSQPWPRGYPELDEARSRMSEMWGASGL